MLNFSNTDCLGNSLTYNTPNSFPARIYNNANVQFNNTTYIYLGSKELFIDVTSIGFSTTLSNLSTPTTGKWHIFSNIISNGDYRIKRISYNYDDSKWEILVNNILYTYAYTMPATQNMTFSFALSISGIPVITINNAALANPTTEDSTEEDDGYAYINAYKSSTDTSTQIGVTTWRTAQSILLYNDSSLIHAYNLAEGADKYIYDNVGDLHGILITSSLSTARIFENAKFPFNTIWGFTIDEQPALAITNARSSKNKNLIIYKSDWREGNEVGEANHWAISSKVLDVRDNSIVLKNNYSANQSTIATTKTGFNFAPYQHGRTFNVKCKITNLSTILLKQFIMTIGTNYGDDEKHGLVGGTITFDTPLSQNESYDVDLNLDVTESSKAEGFLKILCIRFVYDSRIPMEEECGLLSNLMVTQTNKTITNYASDTPYGINYSESKLSFSNTLTNIPELHDITTNLNIYPKLWYKDTSFNDNHTGITFQLGTSEFTKLGSLLTYVNSNLSGVTLSATNTLTNSVINIAPQTGFALQKEFAKGTWHFKCKIYNMSNATWTSQSFSIGIGNGLIANRDSSGDITSFTNNYSKALAYKTISLNTIPTVYTLSDKNITITEANAEVLEFDLDSNNIDDVALTSQLIFISTSDGFLTDTTIDRRWGISDIELTYTPASDTYAPYYFKKNETNNAISNILVYKKPQLGVNLSRIINHVNHI